MATASDLESAVQVFNNQPVQAALNRYGMPDSQFMAGDIRVLVWEADTTMRYHRPVTTTTTGRIGDAGAYPWYSAIPYRQTSTSSEAYDEAYHCILQVGVRPDGTIERVGASGKMGACQAFMP